MEYQLQIYRAVLLLLSTCLLSIEVESTEKDPPYCFYQQPGYPRDCREALDQCSSDSSSGVYVIKPDGYLEPFEVFCDNDVSPGGWTVIQRRYNGSLTFRRNLEDYESGFGFLSSEFWIGHDKLSYLTNQAVYELRIDIMLANGSSFYAKYSSFRISDEFGGYAIVSAAEFSSDLSCIVSTCPLNMTQERCTCQNLLCTDPTGQADCYTECVETCVPEGCVVTGTNSFIMNDDSYINADCTQNCTCIDNQLVCNPDYECSTQATCKVKEDIRKCYCNEGYEGNGETCIRSFTDCFEVYQAGHTTDGLYRILPIGWPGSPFTVFCDMTTSGGGWTVIQRRMDGVTDFYRDWNQYKVGFGSPTFGNDLWLGNEKIYFLTNQNGYRLRVNMVTSGSSQYYAEYASFQINNEINKYRLSISNFSGNAGNRMESNSGVAFSTHDQNNSGCNDKNFAEGHRGAWWYYGSYCSDCFDITCSRFEYGKNGCYTIGTLVNLNGDYNGRDGKKIFWSCPANLKFTEMKIRPSFV